MVLTVIPINLMPNYEIIYIKKYLIFPHRIDVKIVASENAEWLVTSENHYSGR